MSFGADRTKRLAASTAAASRVGARSSFSIERETSSAITTALRRSSRSAATEGRAIATAPAATASSARAAAPARSRRARGPGPTRITRGSA